MSPKRVRELQKRLKEIQDLEALNTGLPEHKIKILKESIFVNELSQLGVSDESVERICEPVAVPISPSHPKAPVIDEDTEGGWSQVGKGGKAVKPTLSKPRFPTHLSKSLTSIIHTKPDGSCLFQSLSHWLNISPGDVRRKICKFLSTEAESVSIGDMTLSQWIEMESGDRLQDYITRLKKPTTWGGQAELFACSKEFNVPVSVWVEETHDRYLLLHEFNPQPKSTKTCHVLFDGSEHYDIITLKSEVSQKIQDDQKQRTQIATQRK